MRRLRGTADAAFPYCPVADVPPET